MAMMNKTALDYSLEVVDAVISYMQGFGHPESYTIAPINEPVDNTDPSHYGTPLALSDAGAAWVLQYILAVILRVPAGSFRGKAYCENITSYICSYAEESPGDGKFPVFIGE
ncbi:hypothetical protein BDW75DRAFT_227084 [Aspergillus navahoensis]